MSFPSEAVALDDALRAPGRFPNVIVGRGAAVLRAKWPSGSGAGSFGGLAGQCGACGGSETLGGLGNGDTLTTIGWSWTPGARPLLTAVPDTDGDGDGKPDLWATTADGTLSFYSNSAGAGTMVGSGGWTPFQQLS